MKNILLPTDFSKNSMNAIHYAINLFKDITCTFYLLNVYKIPYLTDQNLTKYDKENLNKLERSFLDKSRENLDKTVLQLKLSPNHHITTNSDYNFLIDSIKDFIIDKKIDLIVMGTKGATGAKEIFMGSNTGDVIMKTDCNVLAVPENVSFEPPMEIAFPTNFKNTFKEEDFTQLIEISEIYKSNVRIIFIDDKGKLDKEQKINKAALDLYLKNVINTHHTLTNIDLESAINCFTQSRGNVNMISLIAKHYNFFQRLFFTPKVEELSFHTKTPLLVLHKVGSKNPL